MSDAQSESPASNTDDETPLEMVVGGMTIGGILTVAFGLLALGVPWFWVVFPVGFAGVLPAAIGLTRLYERRQRDVTSESAPSEREAALETLRGRYARGEIDDDEFERRLAALLETESVTEAADYVARESVRETDRT